MGAGFPDDIGKSQKGSYQDRVTNEGIDYYFKLQTKMAMDTQALFIKECLSYWGEFSPWYKINKDK